MANALDIQWIYPPNWDKTPNFPDYGGGFRKVIFRMTCISDGTDETDEVKLDISELRTVSGNIPIRTVIERIDFNIYGLTVKLEWDRAPKVLIASLNASSADYIGKIDWRPGGGLVDPSDGLADQTGDILLTSTNSTAADSYDITMAVRLKDH